MGMTDRITGEIREEARLWAIRAGDPAFADWDGLTLWLEADPRHLAAYDAALDDEAWAVELLGAAPAPQGQPMMAEPEWTAPRRRFLRPLTGALAASIALVAGAGGWYALQRDPVREYVTGPAERRTIALADGSRIVMNGGTRLGVHTAHPRQVILESGEALFDVRHDDRQPFTVQAGDTRLVDVGTMFNVVEAGGRLDVAVARGAVIYRARQDAIRLDAGDTLSRAGPDEKPVLRKADPETIGGWQGGYLTYADADMRQIGADLGRNIGQAVEVDPGVAGRHFSGTLAISGKPEDVMARTAPLLGVRIVRQGDGWRMTAADGPRP